MNQKLLVVENDINLQTILKDYFTSYAYDVFLVSKGSEVMAMIETNGIDGVILDVMLDDLDGWSVLRKIKQTVSLPVIMLTARSEASDKIFGLELGADDYLTKPFSLKELHLRIEHMLSVRHSNHTAFQLITNTYEVNVDGKKTKLTKQEFEVLKYLYEHPKEVISRERLLEMCWGYLFDGDTRTVDTTIKRIRHKLSHVSCIHTVFGVGYYFEVQR